VGSSGCSVAIDPMMQSDREREMRFNLGWRYVDWNPGCEGEELREICLDKEADLE